MMILEMVGGSKNIKTEAETSDIYFPKWIYKHLELGKNLGLHGGVTTEEDEAAKKEDVLGGIKVHTRKPKRETMHE